MIYGKFRVMFKDENTKVVKLYAVTADEANATEAEIPENARFAAATPRGCIDLTIDNAATFEQIENGEILYMLLVTPDEFNNRSIDMGDDEEEPEDGEESTAASGVIESGDGSKETPEEEKPEEERPETKEATEEEEEPEETPEETKTEEVAPEKPAKEAKK